MILTTFYEAQDKLDLFVRENLNMTAEEFNDVEMVDNRVFALKVELAEFANETGWFKYWKRSHVVDRKATLEEHADVTHFFLSVGLSRNYNTFIPEIDPHQWHKVPLKHLFNYIMQSRFESSGHWKNAFEQHIQIGLKLGFTIGELTTAYFAKNAVNFERQKSGY